MPDTRGPLLYRAWIDGVALPLTGYLSATTVASHKAGETCTIEFPPDTPHLGDLLSNRLVLTVTHQPTGRQWWSGKLKARDVAPTADGKIQAVCKGDRDYLRDIRAWPNPAAKLDAQGTDAWRMTGPAESVAKALIGANLTRLGIRHTMAPDKKRGQQITVAARFTPIWDELVDRCAAADIGILITRDPVTGDRLIDVYQPSADVLPIPLTIAGGIIQSASWHVEEPAATRLVIGGHGEGAQRQLLEVVSGAAESAWGEPIEDFIEFPSATASTTGDDMMLHGLSELVARSGHQGLPVTLGETDTFRYGVPGGVQIGTTVTLQIAGQTVTHIVSQVTISDTPDRGIETSITIGDPDLSDPDVRTARAIASLNQAIYRYTSR